MESYSKYFALICIVGGSIAANASPDHSPEHDEISWSPQSSSVNLVPRNADVNKQPQIESESLVAGDILKLGPHSGAKNTMHSTNLPNFVPRREVSSHHSPKKNDPDSSSSSSSSSSSASSSSSSEESTENHEETLKKSHKRHSSGSSHLRHPSPSFHRGTKPHHGKRYQRNSHLDGGYGRRPYPNGYDQYPGQLPESYGQYGLPRVGSHKRHMGSKYYNFNQKPYPASFHGQPAGMNVPLMAH